MSAARHPTVLKTSTFSNKDCEKHFQYVCYLSNSNTKLKRISQTNNTHGGHCSMRIQKIASHDSMEDEIMETILPQESFLRVHRSYIVNLKRISSYTKGRIFLDNGEYIPLGENYKERFFERFNAER